MNELGHIEQAGEFDAENDATAIAAVERVRGRASLELWCGSQKGEALGRYPRQLADRVNLGPLAPEELSRCTNELAQ